MHETQTIVTDVSHGPLCSVLCTAIMLAMPIFALYDLILRFLQILPQLKKFSQKSNCAIILVLDATFVPNLMFLGLLSSIRG